MKADNLHDIYDRFNNEPVVEDLEKYYVRVDQGRGPTPVTKLKRLLTRNPGGDYAFLFAGYRGCGKSAELLVMQKELETDFTILNFSVRKELDILNISYIELFIAVMKALFDFVEREENIKINDKFIKSVLNWVRSKEIVKINDKYLGMELKTGASVKGGIPLLAEFFAKFTASARASASLKETLRETVEPKLSELIFNCNALINEIKGQIQKIGKKGLIIIMILLKP